MPELSPPGLPPGPRRDMVRAAQSARIPVLQKIYAAFLNSLAGLRHGLSTERAIRQEALLLLAGIPLALLIGSNALERLVLVLALVAVLCVEFLNTAIEKLCDHVTPERHETIRAIKDMASTACFLVQASAGAVWLVVLGQRLMA